MGPTLIGGSALRSRRMRSCAEVVSRVRCLSVDQGRIARMLILNGMSSSPGSQIRSTPSATVMTALSRPASERVAFHPPFGGFLPDATTAHRCVALPADRSGARSGFRRAATR